MIPKLILNNCTINVYVFPQGVRAEVKPNGDPAQLQSKPLQLERKEPVWISPKEASELFGLSTAFFHTLAKKYPQLSDADNGIRVWLDQEAVRDHLDTHPEHKAMSLAKKKLINIPMLTERAYRILQDEGREMYPDTSKVPHARRNRYMSYSELARTLGISQSMFYSKIRLPLAKMIKEKPEETAKKNQEDKEKEWERVAGSWNRISKR